MLGEEPTKAWGEGDVKSRYNPFFLDSWIGQSHVCRSTLGCAYAQLIDSFSEAAQDHVNLADGLDAQVVNVLKLVEKRHEEAKKKVHTQLLHSSPPNIRHSRQQVKAFQKLLSDRDRAYGDRVKVRRFRGTLPVLRPLAPHSLRVNKWYLVGPLCKDATG